MDNKHPIIESLAEDLLTRDHLRKYLGVGRNRIPEILERFELHPVEGKFPIRAVWRQILWIEPVDAEQEALLREHLRPTGWVAAQVRRGHSTVRTKLREHRFEYPEPAVDLGDPDADSRSKRWIPAQIRAATLGDDVPRFPVAAPHRALEARLYLAGTVTNPDGPTCVNNAFARILHDNARLSPQ